MELTRFILLISCFAYGLSFVFYASQFLKQAQASSFLGFLSLFTAFLLQTACLILSGLEINMLPVFSLAEALNFFSWTLILVYLLISRRLATKSFPILILPLVLVCSVLAILFSVQPQVPDLKVAILPFLVHVVSAFLSYSAFTVAFIAGLFYLIQDHALKSKKLGLFYHHLSSLNVLEQLVYRAIAFGFVLLSISLGVGALLFRSSQGIRLDGTMAFSFLLWCFYLGVLYLRHGRHWRGRKVVLFSTFAFALVFFTFLGLQIWGSPLHTFKG